VVPTGLPEGDKRSSAFSVVVFVVPERIDEWA
jgi:hypothetical protein